MKWAIVILAVASTVARAEDRDFLPQVERELAHPAPDPGRDAARVGPPAWCSDARGSERFDSGGLVDDLSQWRSSHYTNRLIRAAANLCRAPDGPTVHRIAAEIEQYWINLTGLSEKDAVATLAARADPKALAEDRKQLCDALKPTDDDAESETYALANARSVLFFCQSADMPVAPWLKDTPGSLAHLTAYLDRGPVERDEIVKLAWVMVEAWHETVENTVPEYKIARYAIDQFDFATLSRDKVLRALDAPPYRDNRFARAFVLETLGQWSILRARIEAEVRKRSTDPAWKEVLVTAPQRGAAAWLAAADKLKDALARSDEFERKFKESRTGGRGCLPGLRGDVVALLKSLKHDRLDTLREQLFDHPLAGLLLERLEFCQTRDGDPNVGVRIAADLGVPVIRGPRTAAYRAAIEALAPVAKRLRVSSDPFPKLEQPGWYPSDEPQRFDGANYGRGQLGVVSAIKRMKHGIRVSFVRRTTKMMSQKCHESDKVDRIESDGKVVYRQVCRDAGLVTVKDSPNDVVIDSSLAGGIQVGRALEASRLDGVRDGSPAIPIAVYADKLGQKLVAVDGMVLE